MSNEQVGQDGAARFTVILSKELKAKVESFHDTYKISQGDVIEVLVAQADAAIMGKHFEAKRDSKVELRGKMSETKKALLDKIKDLSPEALEKLLKSVG